MREFDTTPCLYGTFHSAQSGAGRAAAVVAGHTVHVPIPYGALNNITRTEKTMEKQQWLETHAQVASLQVVFSKSWPNEEPHGVTLTLRTGEVRTLNGLSLSSQPLAEQEDCVLSVILAMAVLTQLLSSWKESVLRTTAVQPRMLITFLMVCEMITSSLTDLAAYAIESSTTRRRKPWSRNG